MAEFLFGITFGQVDDQPIDKNVDMEGERQTKRKTGEGEVGWEE